MSNCIPCSPCNTNCPDDWEILSVDILDPEDCNTSCCWKSCSDNRWINIQSTNDCLTVDTSECGVVKLTAKCPKPTYVKAWDNVTVRDVTPPDDCYIDWGDCDIEGWWEVSATDEKVKACSGDTTPGFLNQKIEWSKWINVEPIWCDGSTNSKLRLTFNDEYLPECEYPDIVVNNSSKIIDTAYSWHTIWISDKETTSYDNMVCLGFERNKDYRVTMDNDWNSTTIEWVNTNDSWRTVFTWNKAMATHNWIKILESWYYRIFWQLTVENNLRKWISSVVTWAEANEYYINLWRAFLRVTRWGQDIYLSTAKHWAYARQVLLTGWQWISVSQDWAISFTWGSFSWSWQAPEWWGTVSISWTISTNAWWGTQTNSWFDWPWATFNIDAYVDLHKNDIVTLWYRPQSDMAASQWQYAYFRFVWSNDTSTEFERVFWGSILWAHLVAPKLFQSWAANQIYDYI